MLYEFADKHVLITGGTSGIGRAIALAFAAQHAHVTVTGLTDDEVDEFTERNPGISAVPLDVADADAVAHMVAGLDQLDILVNCAGMVLRDGLEHQADEFAQVVDVNLLGTMRVTYGCRELLTATRGCVVNTASMLSFFGSGSVPAYSASKGGITQLTKSLAIAWADLGIRVNAVAPGWIETPLTTALRNDPERSRPLLERTPLRRWGQPEDVAGAVVFLCSSSATFITGVILPVDGGYSVT